MKYGRWVGSAIHTPIADQDLVAHARRARTPGGRSGRRWRPPDLLQVRRAGHHGGDDDVTGAGVFL